MKKTVKRWTADKFRMFIVAALMLNAAIFLITGQQKSYWVGNVISDAQTKLTRTEQFLHNLTIRSTSFEPNSVDQYVDSYDYNYDFTLLEHSQVVLNNEAMPIKTGYHQYFAIDDECAIVFRSPKRRIINNSSIMCLYNL